MYINQNQVICEDHHNELGFSHSICTAVQCKDLGDIFAYFTNHMTHLIVDLFGIPMCLCARFIFKNNSDIYSSMFSFQ